MISIATQYLGLGLFCTLQYLYGHLKRHYCSVTQDRNTPSAQLLQLFTAVTWWKSVGVKMRNGFGRKS